MFDCLQLSSYPVLKNFTPLAKEALPVPEHPTHLTPLRPRGPALACFLSASFFFFFFFRAECIKGDWKHMALERTQIIYGQDVKGDYFSPASSF